MSKELVALLKKTLRMPWEVRHHPRKHDQVIRSRLVSESNLARGFEETPKHEDAMVQAIALPVLMALTKSKIERIVARDLWGKLTLDEKKLIVRHYGMRDQYTTLVQMIPDAARVTPLASYIGACYAFTCETVPIYADFGQIVDAAMAWERAQPSRYDEFSNAGMLIVRGMLARHPDAHKVEGALLSLFTTRLDCFKQTVFLEVPPDVRIANRMTRGKLPAFDTLETMVVATDAGKGVLGNFMCGANTYINFNTNAREFNDDRFGLSL